MKITKHDEEQIKNCIKLKELIMDKAGVKITIPLKLPSLNNYINACRSNRYAGAKMKEQVEDDISWYIKALPKFNKPVKIVFEWVESNKKRDLDNICFAKKFILDSMVKCGKLENDNRNYVIGFEDKFSYAKENKVILEIAEERSNIE